MGEERNEGPERSRMERAEELLDQAGQTAGFFVSTLGFRMARFASLAREEAEDVWAEARNVRHEMRQSAGETPDVEGETETGDAFEATDEARLKAAELGVNLGRVTGTGTNGEITVEDVSKEAGAGS